MDRADLGDAHHACRHAASTSRHSTPPNATRRATKAVINTQHGHDAAAHGMWREVGAGGRNRVTIASPDDAVSLERATSLGFWPCSRSLVGEDTTRSARPFRSGHTRRHPGAGDHRSGPASKAFDSAGARTGPLGALPARPLSRARRIALRWGRHHEGDDTRGRACVLGNGDAGPALGRQSPTGGFTRDRRVGSDGRSDMVIAS